VIAAPRDIAPQPSTPLAAACATDLPQPAAASFPWRPAPRSRLIPLFEARSDTQRRERPGPSGELVPAEGQPRAARRRSSSKPRRSHPQGSRRLRPSIASALTATAADNPTRSAGRAAHALTPDHPTPSDASRPADLHASSAVTAPRNRDATWTAANAGATTTSPSPTAVAHTLRVGLIEQSTRAAGDGFPARSSSTRPAGCSPAVLTTQGEMN
jgi:hypothetical protein